MTAAGPPPRSPTRSRHPAPSPKPGEVMKSTRSRNRCFSCGMMTTKRLARHAMSAAPPLPGRRSVGLRQSPMELVVRWPCRPAAMTISSRSVYSAMRDDLVKHEGLGPRGRVGMLPDRLLVDLDAEPGPRRHLDETVTRRDGIREEGRLVLARGELDGNGPTPGGRHVERRGQPRSEIEGMGREGQIGRLGERRDLSELRDAAHLGDAGLQDVAGP